MSRGDYAAFPRPYSRDVHTDGNPITYHGAEGMTIRECAAIAAMQGLLACDAPESKGPLGDPYEVVAVAAVGCADALLAELAKPAR